MWYVGGLIFLFAFFWTAYVAPLPARDTLWISTEAGFVMCAFLCFAAGLWVGLENEP